MLINTDEIKDIFELLNSAGYYFQAHTPQQLLKNRKYSDNETELVKLFGLGELKVIDKINLNTKIKNKLKTEPISVSCDLEGNYLIHSRWPPNLEKSEQYIHLGPESFYLAHLIKNSDLTGKDILDLGCSSGVLSFAASNQANAVVGIDSSKNAIEAANSLKDIRNKNNIDFIHYKINSTDKIDSSLEAKFDLVVFNPPLGIPEESNYFPHRDGGNMGYQIPLLFLNYANQAVKKLGEIWCLIASPIVNGERPFEKELSKIREIKVLACKVIESHFNQMVYKSHGYEKLGIDRIELCIYKIKKI